MKTVLKIGSVSDEDVDHDSDKKDLDFVISSGYFGGMDDDCNTYEED